MSVLTCRDARAFRCGVKLWSHAIGCFSIEEGLGSGLNLDKYRELFQKGAGGEERRRSHTQLPQFVFVPLFFTRAHQSCRPTVPFGEWSTCSRFELGTTRRSQHWSRCSILVDQIDARPTIQSWRPTKQSLFPTNPLGEPYQHPWCVL